MKLSDNIWWTRQSRIRAEKRLLSNAFNSQVLLLWYSFYSVAISIYYFGQEQSALASKSWLIYSVLILTVSGFINGFSYKERANLIKENYERLKSLYNKAKLKENNKEDTSPILTEYEIALNKCENHTVEDYLEALYDTVNSSIDKTKIDPNPTEYQYKKAEFNRKKRFATLSLLYSLPVFITIIMNVPSITSCIVSITS